MSLDARYIPLYNLQQFLIDKDTNAPLSGGSLTFYSDVTGQLKTVYELTFTNGQYSYTPLPNPVKVGSSGTPVNNSDADVVIYAFPYDESGNIELYYVLCKNKNGNPQWTRNAVPSEVIGSNPDSDASVYNYIPNGQFLLHTDLPNNGELLAGSNITAQGGWFVELNDPLYSSNTYAFESLGFTEDPAASPRFMGVFTASTPNTSDSKKWIGVKFDDVNKFSANNDFYTFSFWARGNVNIPISILVVKYFGTTGSATQIISKFTDVINTDGQNYQYQFQFGTNEGEVVDLVNNDDYVAVVISLPIDIGFIFEHTDFVLANGQLNIASFPLQTNADMITRSNDGWTNIPKYDGYDLFLPKVQSRAGYEYAEWEVGDIGKTIRTIVSPLSDSPLPKGNRMAFDGANYIYSDYSAIGIPFARLGDVLIEESSIANTPLWGTGSDFATAYVNHGDVNIFRLTVNLDGVGVNYAEDGDIPTGFDFTGIPIYDGSTAGGSLFNYFSFSNGQGGALSNQLICKANFQADYPDSPNAYVFDGSIATGFSFDAIIYNTGLYAQQSIAFNIHTVDAASLIQGPTNEGAYFYFYTAANEQDPYVIWFKVDEEVQPTTGVPGGAIFIQVNLNISDTAVDVAYTLIEVMKALQSTSIKVGVVPAPGSYFTFQTNPASVHNFHVWYSDETGGTEPIILGSIGINAKILSTDSFDVIVTKTLIAINKYQYTIPYAGGMFFRNADPEGVWDMDNLTRWSNVTGVVGPAVGTFEFSQFFGHYHLQFNADISGAGLSGTSGSQPYPTRQATYSGSSIENYEMGGNANSNITVGLGGISGGSETRPVNMGVNYYIKY